MPRKKTALVADPEPATPKPRGKRYSSFKEAAAHKARPAVEARSAAKREELSKLTTEGDLVDIWESRINDPNHHESVPIRIKTPGMKVRWINLANRGRYYRARYEQGWVPVHRSELFDEREVFGVTYTSESYVCRGEKQSEMLMKIPQAVFDRIQRRKAELARESTKKLRDNLGKAGGAHFKEKYDPIAGEQAEEAASRFRGDISAGTERVTTDELFE